MNDIDPYEWVTMSRRGGAVKRCHTVRTLTENTVATHSFGVALLVISMTEGKASNELLKAALFHDLAEQVVGDTPATTKWSNPELRNILKDMENRFDEKYGLTAELCESETNLLKICDMLDFLFYVVEELKLGNQHIKPCFGRALDFLMEKEIDKHPVGKRIIDGLLNSLV